MSWNSFRSPLWVLLCGKPLKLAEIEESFTLNTWLLIRKLPNAPSDNSSSWMKVPSAISLVCPDLASYNLRSCQTTLITWVSKECYIKIQPSNPHFIANHGIGRENINPKENHGRKSYHPTADEQRSSFLKFSMWRGTVKFYCLSGLFCSLESN